MKTPRRTERLYLSDDALRAAAPAEPTLEFEVFPDPIDGGFVAAARGCGIFTQADALTELRRNIIEATECYFDEGKAPAVVRVLFFDEDPNQERQEITAALIGYAQATA